MQWYEKAKFLYKLANLFDDIKKYGPTRDRSKSEFDIENLSKQYNARQYFALNYGWSVPTQEAIEKLKDFIGSDMVLEVGSGHGLWAKLLQDAEINVIATDFPQTQVKYLNKKEPFTNVEPLSGEEAVLKYPLANVLFMSWPPYDNPLAFNVLANFKGNKLIFIGEGSGGCTANDDFFKELDENWQETGTINIPQWEFIHDYISLYRRR